MLHSSAKTHLIFHLKPGPEITTGERHWQVPFCIFKNSHWVFCISKGSCVESSSPALVQFFSLCTLSPFLQARFLLPHSGTNPCWVLEPGPTAMFSLLLLTHEDCPVWLCQIPLALLSADCEFQLCYLLAKDPTS